MPRVGNQPRPAVPIRALKPGSPFRLQGSQLRGIYLEMIGEDAKVLLTDARAPTYWSGASPVFLDDARPVAAPVNVSRSVCPSLFD